jgi:transposase
MRTSHYWAREIVRFGHEVRLMPPAYVKPYVKRGKTDANDAEATCEAVTRPTMRFVAIKSAEQQGAQNPSLPARLFAAKRMGWFAPRFEKRFCRAMDPRSP